MIESSNETAEKFFSTLFGNNAPGWITLWTRNDKKTFWFPADKPRDVISTVNNLSVNTDVYYGVGLRKEQTLGRGTIEDILSIPALWLDIDIAGGSHKQLNLPGSLNEANDLLQCFPLAPSIIVHTGGGLHAYWLLDEMWQLHNPEDRKEAINLMQEFQRIFIYNAKVKGWSLDNTSDLARVLRVPGTTNFKASPLPVQSLKCNGGIRYTKDNIAKMVEELTGAFAPKHKFKEPRTEDKNPYEDNSDCDMVLERCAFLQHCRDDASVLPEPEWFAMLTIMARTNQGEAICHELSLPYPGYNEAETDQKIRHALKDSGPTTCEKIRNDFGTWCTQCKETVTSPIVLGLRSPVNIEYKVEPFPVEALPGCFARFVEEGASALGCPPEFIAIPLLVLAGTAIGTTKCIELKPSWREGTQLYAAIVATPGSKKSPALSLAMAPLTERQKVLKSDYDRMKEEYEVSLAKWEEEREFYKGLKKPNNKPVPFAEKPEKPFLERVYTTDVTVEALAILMEQNPRGVALIQDELASWTRGMNQYKSGKGTDKQFFLSCWSGTPYVVDRKSQDEPIVLPRTFLSVVGCIPPDILEELTDKHGRQDGFVHRILFCFPDPVIASWNEKIISSSAKNEVDCCFEKLWRLNPTVDGQGHKEPVVMPLSHEAKRIWVEWYNTHCQEQSQPGFNELWEGPWAKMPAQVARMALIIHVCRFETGETNCPEVDEISMAMAAAIGHYFKEHLKRIYQRLQDDPLDRKIRQTVNWIRKHGQGGVTARELLSHKVAGCKTSPDAKTLLDTLFSRNLGYWKEPSAEGRGRKTRRFFLSALC